MNGDLTTDEALSLIDPLLVSELPNGMVRELLDVARGIPHRSRFVLTTPQLNLIRRHRVLPLVPIEWADSAETAHERIRLAGLQLSLERSWRELNEVLGPLSDSVRVLKGMATSRLDYPTPALRHTGDIDLLVPSDLLAETADLLLRNGYKHQSFVDIRRLPMDKGFPLIDKNGLEVDLHTRLLWKRSTEVRELFESPVSIPSLGALAMPPELRLVHATIHFIATAPGTRRLSGCADVAVLLSEIENLDAALAVAKRMGVAGLCAAGLSVVTNLTGINKHDSSLATWPRSSALEHAAFLRAKRIGLIDRFARMMDLPGVSQKAKFASAVLFPQKAMRDEHGGWKGHAARAFRG